MPEWVDYQHISDRHRYIQENDQPFCFVCGNGPENHWYPKKNPKIVLDEAERIADEAFRKMME